MSRLGRWAAPLVGLGLSVALLLQTGRLDEVAREGQLGPGFWPRLILIMLGLACAAKLLAGRSPAPVAGTRPTISRAILGLGVALIILYVLVAPFLGFPLATALFVAAFMMVGGARPGPALGAGAVGTALLLYLFVRIVYLPLPKGEGPLEAFTLGLYRLLGIF
jgi:putative tricarboxylic transport membrane protein